ncbi:MAG: glycosyltransferase, partial [Chitinophagia bacterium]|nr:glycosyltransferase [Chitinophagia bacterium]
GVPVISSNTGGLPEINIDGNTGFLSNVGDVADMSEKALAIITDPTTLNLFKKNALEQARRFEKQLIIPQYEQLYCEVVKKHKAHCTTG